jgi:hypothetical protein
VVNFVRSNGPEAAIRELVLPSRRVTAAIGDALMFSVCLDEPQDVTCNRLLWKLGFDKARYEDEYVLLRTRLDEFREEVLRVPERLSEEDRSRVRARGVNLFVSVEQFLETIVAYNVWLLASDHFTGTRFRYTKEDALSAVSSAMGPSIESGQEVLLWSTSGANSIGVLLGYLNAFRQWLRSRDTADRGAICRKEADYPHYAKDPLYAFPFRHTELWADVTPETMAAYTGLIDRICVQVSQAELTVVRNGLDHKREEDSFPTTDRMLACVSRVQDALDIADRERLVPKLYWVTKSEEDADGNECHSVADYRGSVLPLWGPSLVAAVPSISSARPYVVAPLDLINEPNSPLVFEVAPRTEYREYWKDYPRRRAIPANADAHEEEGSRPRNGVQTLAGDGSEISDS